MYAKKDDYYNLLVHLWPVFHESAVKPEELASIFVDSLILCLLLVPQEELMSSLSVVSSCFVFSLRVTTCDNYSSVRVAQASKPIIPIT